MATSPKRIYTGQPATTIGTLYTVPTATKAIVKNIVLTNTTTTATDVTIHFVPSGGVADATNKVMSSYNVGASDTVVLEFSAVLEDSDTIQALQSTTGAITIYASGVEVN